MLASTLHRTSGYFRASMPRRDLLEAPDCCLTYPFCSLLHLVQRASAVSRLR